MDEKMNAVHQKEQEEKDYQKALKLVSNRLELLPDELERIAKEFAYEFIEPQVCLTMNERNAWPEVSEERIRHVNRCRDCTNFVRNVRVKIVDVYLAGGMRGGWHDFIKKELKDLHDAGLVRWSDPRANNTNKPEEYIPLDIIRAECADVIFGYMENDNPGGYTLVGEIVTGHYNKATTILVNDIYKFSNEKKYRYFSFTPDSKWCDFVTDNLCDGAKILRKVILAMAKSDA
ncbi:hypothetical protein GW950_00325 [Candidatus Wolfebacteria bacterium]|nr:hypothetical protein [Candidatus Wolfebacteria bacterium]